MDLKWFFIIQIIFSIIIWFSSSTCSNKTNENIFLNDCNEIQDKDYLKFTLGRPLTFIFVGSIQKNTMESVILSNFEGC